MNLWFTRLKKMQSEAVYCCGQNRWIVGCILHRPADYQSTAAEGRSSHKQLCHQDRQTMNCLHSAQHCSYCPFGWLHTDKAQILVLCHYSHSQLWQMNSYSQLPSLWLDCFVQQVLSRLALDEAKWFSVNRRTGLIFAFNLSNVKTYCKNNIVVKL